MTIETTNLASCGDGSPRIVVLLATRNGAVWLDEQIASIRQQRDVHVTIVASDDRSDDQTRAVLQSQGVCMLPALERRLGSANRNFLRLVCEADVADAKFVALSDQDDIWLPDKLARAVACLRCTGGDAYSSDVLAFWPDGRKTPIVKSQAQQPYDHLFESAGPGCTFVFTAAAHAVLRHWARQHRARLENVKIHDWLFYAFGRTVGWRWHIDPYIGLRYRQHRQNEIGANHGWAAFVRRVKQVSSGAFRLDALAIARAVEDRSWVSRALMRMSVSDRLRLVFHWQQLRRRRRDACFLACFLLFMPRDR